MYRFVRCSHKEIDLGILPASVIVSYCLKIVFDISVNKIFDFGDETKKYYAVLILFSIIAAYICGLLSMWKIINTVLMSIGVIQNFNENIWVDIYNAGGWFEIHKKDMEYSYYGRISAIEDQSDTPVIIVKEYELVYPMTIDPYKKIKPIDLEDGTTESIAIRTDDIDYIKIYNTSKTEKNKKRFFKNPN